MNSRVRCPLALCCAWIIGTSVLGCSSESSETACPIGSEGCACTDGDACDSGLSCRSDVCVDLGAPGAGGSGGGAAGSGGGSGSGGAGGVGGSDSGGAETGGSGAGAGGTTGGAGAGGTGGTDVPLSPECPISELGGSARADRQVDFSGGAAGLAYFVVIGSGSLVDKIAVDGVLCSLTGGQAVSTAPCSDLYACGPCKLLIALTDLSDGTWVMSPYGNSDPECAKYEATYWLTPMGGGGGVSEACTACSEACSGIPGCTCCAECGGCLSG